MSYKIDYKTKSGSFELYVDDKKAVEYFKKKVTPMLEHLEGYKVTKVEIKKSREEETNQLLSGLYSISEMMRSDLFSLDEETEEDMLECGAIEMDTEEMAMALDEAIALIEKLKKLNLGGL
tara:strand:- start:1252 stop:1614 length:363 start_codon:yes stop_codon:yes gene_type:complete